MAKTQDGPPILSHRSVRFKRDPDTRHRSRGVALFDERQLASALWQGAPVDRTAAALIALLQLCQLQLDVHHS